MTSPKMTGFTLTLALTALALATPPDASAFCGFYVARADASLYNEASRVVVARHDGKTVIGMMNDYQGDLTEFALVVPVPVVLREGQVHIGDKALFDRIDAFTAPRLVEYHDPSPCQSNVYRSMERSDVMAMQAPTARPAAKNSLGVTVEASYTVGEYDIVVLSAEQSDGLETWLRENGYQIPRGARRALRPYVRQDMKFFVAKVNLDEQARTGLTYLRPLQFAFESEKFLLPIRLGMLNAQGPQDLLVYVLTRDGRVETTNYPTRKLPTGMDLPPTVKPEFAEFYRAMFDEQVRKANRRAVFTEYFWNMGWCDPCAADPMSRDELRKLGVFWLDDDARESTPGGRFRAPGPVAGPLPVVVTRLHVRYENETFPEDLVFQETGDRENFQGRYVIRHPWKGSVDECAEAGDYFQRLRSRQEQEARTLAELTGWDLDGIRSKMPLDRPVPRPEPTPWWENLWK